MTQNLTEQRTQTGPETCEVFIPHEQAFCGAPTTTAAIGGCIHEHVEPFRICSYHVTQSPRLLCTPCYDSHSCPLVIRVAS